MILIQCVSSKADEPLPAKELYQGQYFDAMRRYAEATGDEWRILSAKHGLVHPDETLYPYDEFGLTEQQAREIAQSLADKGVDSVKVIAGKKYTNPLTPELEAHGIDVVELCRGMLIGERVSKLHDLLHSEVNESLC
jgi:hypothetical protein